MAQRFARRRTTTYSGGRRVSTTVGRSRSRKHMNTGWSLPSWLDWAWGGRRVRRNLAGGRRLRGRKWDF